MRFFEALSFLHLPYGRFKKRNRGWEKRHFLRPVARLCMDNPIDRGRRGQLRCPLTAHRRFTGCPPTTYMPGARPRTPAALRTAQFFKIESKQPKCRVFDRHLGGGCQTWPLRPVWGAVAPPTGVWGCNPLPWSRPRRRAGSRG
jgi:hypothetical protein